MAAVVTLAQAKEQAGALLAAGDYPNALRAYAHLMTTTPGDLQVRLKIADLLARLAMADEAAKLYETLGLYAVRAGHPLPALVAADALVALSRSGDEILREAARIYASDSPLLARYAAPPADEDPNRVIPEPPATADSFDQLVDSSVARAIDLAGLENAARKFHPLPFFSTLGSVEMLAVLRTLSVRRLKVRDLCMRQGDPGDALFLVAAGEVVVFTTDQDGHHREIARLQENSLFGEMALITDQPRSASVVAVEEADVIEVSRAALGRVTEQLPAIGAVLDRFARERLIKNVLATSPLFTPFSPSQQADLLQRFEGIELAPGALAIAEGQPGKGLFVVLSGRVEVISSATGTEVTLAHLRSGDVFGEMSLLGHQLTSATVRAIAPTTVLFLHRDYFEKLVAAIPELRAYFESLTQQRAADTGFKLGRMAMTGHANAPPATHEDHLLI